MTSHLLKTGIVLAILLGQIATGEGAGGDGSKPCRTMPITMAKKPDPGEGGFIFYASDYHQHEIYASPDTPSMIAFGQENRLAKPKARRLILDLPKGFRVYGGRNITEPIQESSLTIGGSDYARFGITISSDESRGSVTELIVSTTLQAPQTLKAYYATELEGEVRHQREIPLHIIAIPHLAPPKKMHTELFTLYGVLDAWPDDAAFGRIGLSDPTPEYMARVIHSGAFTKARVDFLRFTCADEEDRSVLIGGQPVTRAHALSCPSARGKSFKAILDKGRRAIDLGVYEHIFDPERGDGDDVCYCTRCLKLFRDQWNAEGGLKFMDPRVFMNEKKQYPAYHQAWTEFKLRNEHEQYRLYREAMRKHMAARGLDPNRFRMMFWAYNGCESYWRDPRRWMQMKEYYLQDPMLLKDLVDIYSPMLYITNRSVFYGVADLIEVAEEVRGVIEYTKGALKVYPALSVGWPYFPSGSAANIEPNGMMKDQIFEAISGGAKGFVLYSEGWFDALDMKYVAEAMRQLLPVEGLVMEGAPIPKEHLRDENQAAFAKGVETPTGALILISEYSQAPKTAEVRYKAPWKGPSEVIDLESGRVLAEVSEAKPTFRVVLSQDRARMVQVKPREKSR